MGNWELSIWYWVTRKFGTGDMGKNLYGTVALGIDWMNLWVGGVVCWSFWGSCFWVLGFSWICFWFLGFVRTKFGLDGYRAWGVIEDPMVQNVGRDGVQKAGKTGTKSGRESNLPSCTKCLLTGRRSLKKGLLREPSKEGASLIERGSKGGALWLKNEKKRVQFWCGTKKRSG